MCQCRTLNTQCLLVNLGLLGLEQTTQPAPTLQQSQSLLVKLGLPELLCTVSRQNLNSQRALVKLGPLGPEQKAQPVPARSESELAKFWLKLGPLRPEQVA